MALKLPLHVLSNDIGYGTVESGEQFTVSVITAYPAQIGVSMFGSEGILGGAATNIYSGDVELNTLQTDVSNNVARFPTIVVQMIMTQRLGMWGEGMFGDEGILGAGTLNYIEG